MTDPAPKPMPPRVKMALEIEKVFDPHGDSPIETDQFNAICDICEKWLCRPNPETQAVATEQLDLGNLRVIVECMTCTGKLPHGCPNCKGLDFCVKRHAQKTLDKLEAYRSPVESVPVAVLEKLVEEWRETASRTDADKRYAGHLRKCADRLSAIVKEYSK